jgi:hypothetical protein
MDCLLIRLLLSFYLTNEIVVFVDSSRLPKLFVNGYLNKGISSVLTGLKHYHLLVKMFRVFVYKQIYLPLS